MSSDLIDRYVRRVAGELPFGSRMRARIVDEVRVYLDEAAQGLQEEGLAGEEAQQRAIARFGSPYLVARRFAESRGVTAMATTMTRVAGLAAVAGAILAAVSMMIQFVTTYEQTWTDGVGFIGVVLIGIGLVGMHYRQRGTYGSYGRIGFRLLPAGIVVGAIDLVLYTGILFFLGELLLAAGVILIAGATWRAEILPRSGLAIAVAGFIGVLAANWIPGNAGQITGEPWDWAAAVGVVIFAGGWIVVGLALWREEAQDVRHPAAA